MVKWIVLSLMAIVFLAFGILMLITSYYQNHPITFLALFFSSSLIVLTSLAFLVGMVFQILRPSKPSEPDRE